MQLKNYEGTAHKKGGLIRKGEVKNCETICISITDDSNNIEVLNAGYLTENKTGAEYHVWWYLNKAIGL